MGGFHGGCRVEVVKTPLGLEESECIVGKKGTVIECGPYLEVALDDTEPPPIDGMPRHTFLLRRKEVRIISALELLAEESA